MHIANTFKPTIVIPMAYIANMYFSSVKFYIRCLRVYNCGLYIPCTTLHYNMLRMSY